MGSLNLQTEAEESVEDRFHRLANTIDQNDNGGLEEHTEMVHESRRTHTLTVSISMDAKAQARWTK